MKLLAPSKVLTIVCMIALAAFAKDEIVPETTPQTESEFSGDTLVDEADAGNNPNAPAEIAENEADSSDNGP